ncbi:MAG: nucleotidyltransferase domain-containing protein [Clostridia bacterium]|nr:nucleotidyltransferase domain-containing protein [Clostridia bacterium]
MSQREEILAYLEAAYHPTAILLYGSFAAGMNDETSDFDCMVIVPEKTVDHDAGLVAGVQLDCYLFTEEEVEVGDPQLYLTAYDSVIVRDNGVGERLKARVRRYVEENTVSPPEEKAFLRGWIQKTLRRVQKGDEEGGYRAVMLLAESLEDYCTLRDRFYFGSKKAARLLQAEDPQGYALFRAAVRERTDEAIARWEQYIIGEKE